MYPSPESCATCHDGSVEKKVDWSPPPARPSNFRFTHAEHAKESGEKLPADSALACPACHTPSGATWLTVRRTISAQCLDCHGVHTAHLSAPDTACGTCHFPLAEATAMPEERVAKFEKPASHDDAAFLSSKGHGEQANRSTLSCSICHARDFCVGCHVNAPEVKAIQALAVDSRSLAIKTELKAPASHQESRFLSQHGGKAKQDPGSCAYCHTQESCMACHRAPPNVVLLLPASGPGRGIGARIERAGRPPTRPISWTNMARSLAHRRAPRRHDAPVPGCHRPNAGAAGNYPPGSIPDPASRRHFNREAESGVPQSGRVLCHLPSAGWPASPGKLQKGYHDASGVFLLNHGTAARQNIETCVACHSERDCLACHSAQGGRKFNPHGPGFDAERMKRKNPQTCAACHGNAIP